MRKAGLVGCGGHRRKICSTRRGVTERAPAAPDLGKRVLTPEAPNRLWVADITYARSWEGWLYPAFVLDAYSRRAVDWSMANHLRTALVLDALTWCSTTADRSLGSCTARISAASGTSVEFGSRLKEVRLWPSTGSVANAYGLLRLRSHYRSCRVLRLAIPRSKVRGSVDAGWRRRSRPLVGRWPKQRRNQSP
jgi:putative transposase